MRVWTPIITAVLALIGTIVVAYIQSQSASDEEIVSLIDHRISQVEDYNNRTMPRIIGEINEIKIQLARESVHRQNIQKSLDRILRTLGRRSGFRPESSDTLGFKGKDIDVKKLDLPRMKIQRQEQLTE